MPSVRPMAISFTTETFAAAPACPAECNIRSAPTAPLPVRSRRPRPLQGLLPSLSHLSSARRSFCKPWRCPACQGAGPRCSPYLPASTPDLVNICAALMATTSPAIVGSGRARVAWPGGAAAVGDEREGGRAERRECRQAARRMSGAHGRAPPMS